jgi:hypothetical protein
MSHTPKYRISIDLECWHLVVLFAILMVVVLLQCTCVFGCGGPNSSSVIHNIMPSLQLRKRAPSLALAAEATTKRMLAHKVKNVPLSLIGLPS